MLDSSIWLLASDEYYVDVRLILSYRSLSARWWRKCLGVRTVWSITVFYYLSQTEYNGRTLTVCWPDQQISTSGGSLSPPGPSQDISVNLYTAWHLYGRTVRRGTIWQPRQHQSIARCNPFGHALTNGPWDVGSSITSKWTLECIHRRKVNPIQRFVNMTVLVC